MNGQCQCGGIIRDRNHVVCTKDAMDKWGVDGSLYDRIQIEQSECASCGRYGHRVFSGDGLLIIDRL